MLTLLYIVHVFRDNKWFRFNLMQVKYVPYSIWKLNLMKIAKCILIKVQTVKSECGLQNV